MTIDDDMREIEAALDEFQDASERVYEASHDPGFGDPVQRQKDAREVLLALIRQKLPQTDAEWLQAPLTEREKASAELAGKVVVPWTDADTEHERAVEAWRREAISDPTQGGSLLLTMGQIDEALRLMRNRPPADPAHEAKVAAWEAEATRISIHCGVAMHLVQRMRDEGARLMRARPAGTEAGELLRAAKNAMRVIGRHCDAVQLQQAIEAAERSDIGKILPT